MNSINQIASFVGQGSATKSANPLLKGLDFEQFLQGAQGMFAKDHSDFAMIQTEELPPLATANLTEESEEANTSQAQPLVEPSNENKTTAQKENEVEPTKEQATPQATDPFLNLAVTHPYQEVLQQAIFPQEAISFSEPTVVEKINKDQQPVAPASFQSEGVAVTANESTNFQVKPNEQQKELTTKTTSPAVELTAPVAQTVEMTVQQEGALAQAMLPPVVSLPLTFSETGELLNTQQITEKLSQPIIEKVETMSRPEMQKITVELLPERLGKMEVSIKVTENQVKLEFVVQNPQAKQALESITQKLEQVLNQQEAFKVDQPKIAQPSTPQAVALGDAPNDLSFFNQSAFGQGNQREQSAHQALSKLQKGKTFEVVPLEETKEVGDGQVDLLV